MMHSAQRGAAGVGHQAKDMEVVSQLARRQEEHAALIEGHGRHRLVGVGVEVGEETHDVRVI